MVHEKIFNREDGSKIKITVSAYIPARYEEGQVVIYNVGIYKKAKGKRKWIGYSGPDNKLIQDQIHEAKMEFWLKVKPSSDTKEKDFLLYLEQLFTPKEEKELSKEIKTFEDCHGGPAPDYAEMMSEAAGNEDYKMFVRATRAAYQVFKQSIEFKKERQRKIDSGELIERKGGKASGDIPSMKSVLIRGNQDEPDYARDPLAQLLRDR